MWSHDGTLPSHGCSLSHSAFSLLSVCGLSHVSTYGAPHLLCPWVRQSVEYASISQWNMHVLSSFLASACVSRLVDLGWVFPPPLACHTVSLFSFGPSPGPSVRSDWSTSLLQFRLMQGLAWVGLQWTEGSKASKSFPGLLPLICSGLASQSGALAAHTCSHSMPDTWKERLLFCVFNAHVNILTKTWVLFLPLLACMSRVTKGFKNPTPASPVQSIAERHT